MIGIVPVGHMSENGEQDWAAIRDEARQHVFRRLRTLGITDLEEHIKFEVNYTPLSWRKRYQPDERLHARALPQPDAAGIFPPTQQAFALSQSLLRWCEHTSGDRVSHSDGVRAPGSRADAG